MGWISKIAGPLRRAWNILSFRDKRGGTPSHLHSYLRVLIPPSPEGELPPANLISAILLSSSLLYAISWDLWKIQDALSVLPVAPELDDDAHIMGGSMPVSQTSKPGWIVEKTSKEESDLEFNVMFPMLCWSPCPYCSARGVGKLYNDVRSCGYEDVHLMWSMLQTNSMEPPPSKWRSRLIGKQSRTLQGQGLHCRHTDSCALKDD